MDKEAALYGLLRQQEKGPVAQLGERQICILEVVGSIPIWSTKIMRFYGIATGDNDWYVERFIKADCPEEAAIKYAQSKFYGYSEIATIHEAKLDEYGVLHIGEELCKVELIGPRGYLWDNERFNENGMKCLLCGDFDVSDATFINENGKCRSCAKLRTIRAV